MRLPIASEESFPRASRRRRSSATESRMLRSRLSNSSTSVVFPAPDGATTTKRFPITSLDVLDLLAHLLDQHLHLDRDARDLVRDRFRAERVGLAVELLAEKIEAF